MAQLRNPAREAWLELQILDLLREAPLTQTTLNKRLGIDPKLIKKALARQEGICVIRRQDGAWELLPEPGDIPDEKVELFMSALEKKLLDFEDDLATQGVEAVKIGYSKPKTSLYWDELCYPSSLQVGDVIVPYGDNIAIVHEIEFVGFRRLRDGAAGDFYKIRTSRRGQYFPAEKPLRRRHYDRQK